MTTPQQQQQQPPPAQPPPPPPPPPDDGLVLAIAAVLITAVSADAVMSAITPQLAAFGIYSPAMRGAVSVVMSFPPEQIGVAGPASFATSRQNLLRRAQFVVAASRRITADIRQARSSDAMLSQVLSDSITRERRYYGQHLQAIWNRATAAAQADMAALSYGNVLGWNTVRDSRTSAECRAADGANFSVQAMPLIGWPGAVHPHCRCYPGPPHPGARMLASARPVPVRAVLPV